MNYVFLYLEIYFSPWKLFYFCSEQDSFDAFNHVDNNEVNRTEQPTEQITKPNNQTFCLVSDVDETFYQHPNTEIHFPDKFNPIHNHWISSLTASFFPRDREI